MLRLQHVRTEKFQHDAAMLILRAFQAFLLPPLPLVFAGVVDIKRTVRFRVGVAFALEFDHPFARGVDAEPPEVCHNPTSA